MRARCWAKPCLQPESPQSLSPALLSPCSLHHSVVPSCGSFEGLNRSPPSSQPSCPAPSHRPDPPLGLVHLLLRRGINAAVHPAPTRGAPPLPPHPCAAEEPREPSLRSSIFSGNLVQKLRRLGLHRVVARGERSYERGEQRDAPT